MNKFFSDFFSRGGKVWSTLGSGSKVMVVTFLGLAAVLIAGLGVWSSQPEYVLLYGGLTPEDAAAISGRLGDDKVPFKYEASRGAILVAAGKADTARLALASQGLPHSSTEGFEIFDKTAFGATEFTQRVNFLRAMQGTLARNIQAIDSVENARVSLSIPQEELFTHDKQETKASVIVQMRAGRSLMADQVAAIRHLVASSVPKLEARNVTIVDSSGRMLAKPTDGADASAMGDEQFDSQKRVEQHFTEKVQTLLDQVLGIGQSAVRVTANLNFERTERNVQKMDPDSGVLLEESTRNEDVMGKSGGPAGVPGVASNTGNGASSTAAAEASSNSRRQKSVANKYHYNTVTERVVGQVGSVKRLSVAVLVAPKSTTVDGKVQTTPRTPQEVAALNEVVRSAVGYQADRQDVIKVEELAFSDAALTPAGALPAASPWPELIQRHLSDAFAFIGIIVMALVFMKVSSKLKVTATPTTQTSNASTMNLQQLPPTAMVMQEDLKQLVTQNNAQAVNIIRSMLK